MRGGALLAIVVSLLLPRPAPAETVLSWEEAGKHVGEEVTVEGRVLGVHCSPLSCLLAFDPTFNRFTVVVQARSFDVFPQAELDQRYSGKRVRVRGTIETRDGKPEIVVEAQEQLAEVGAKRRQERDAERAARNQGEALERLADILARIEELTERLVASQERVETLLAQLERNQAALATLQASALAPPPAPSYGEPQPRPAYEHLRTVKRGMSRADVERLIGEPQYVEGGSGGWTTWYYGYGRSISFDGRGRAQALVGFPTP